MADFIILTEAEKDAAAAFDNAEVALGARAVDGPSPGDGLAGKWVVAAAILTDPDYIAHGPEMIAYLGNKPVQSLEPETIFAGYEV